MIDNDSVRLDREDFRHQTISEPRKPENASKEKANAVAFDLPHIVSVVRLALAAEPSLVSC